MLIELIFQDIDFTLYGKHNQVAKEKTPVKLKAPKTNISKTKALAKKKTEKKKKLLLKKDSKSVKAESGPVYVKFCFKHGKRKRSASEASVESVDIEELEAHPYLPPTPAKQTQSAKQTANKEKVPKEKKEKLPKEKTPKEKKEKVPREKKEKVPKEKKEKVPKEKKEKVPKEKKEKVPKEKKEKVPKEKKENKDITKPKENAEPKEKKVKTESEKATSLSSPLKDIQNKTPVKSSSEKILKSPGLKQIAAELEHEQKEVVLSPMKSKKSPLKAATGDENKTHISIIPSKPVTCKTPNTTKAKSKPTSTKKSSTKKAEKNQKSVMDYFKKVVQ